MMQRTTWALAIIAGLMAAPTLNAADPVFPKDAKEALSKYDFSTPKAALSSLWKMEADFDIFAMLAYERVTRGPKAMHKLKTLEVAKEVEFEGKKILFIKYEEIGEDNTKKERKDVVTMIKDADTGYFVRRYVGSFEVSKTNKELGEEMDKWSRVESSFKSPPVKAPEKSPEKAPPAKDGK